MVRLPSDLKNKIYNYHGRSVSSTILVYHTAIEKTVTVTTIRSNKSDPVTDPRWEQRARRFITPAAQEPESYQLGHDIWPNDSDR